MKPIKYNVTPDVRRFLVGELRMLGVRTTSTPPARDEIQRIILVTDGLPDLYIPTYHDIKTTVVAQAVRMLINARSETYKAGSPDLDAADPR